MRFFTSLILTLCVPFLLWAEGTRELAPNSGIILAGTETTDIAALHINSGQYNNFAAYTNPDPHSRLYIHMKDPVTECIYLGFSHGHLNQTTPNPQPINFEFRIKDPNGNVVFGPQTITTGNANIPNWSQAHTGPSQIHGAGGYAAIEIPSTALISQGWSAKGDYYIEFMAPGNEAFLVDFWDISVADCSGVTPTEKKGRIWSYNWAIFAINDFGFPVRPFNGAFYVCAPDPDDDHASFVTKIDFNGSGFRPAAFNIAFNSFGSQNTGDLMIDRMSRPNINSTQSEYSIFLNDPIEICSTAEVGQVELLGISRCDAQGYCIKFQASKAGQVDLLLDFDGDDNIYTPGTADVMVARNVTQDEVGNPACIEWDGLDGLGNQVWGDENAQIPVIIAYSQGIYHFPIYDAELMTNGFTVQAIRPVADIPKLYYDDSNIPQASGSGEPNVQLNGCVTPCHRWTNYTGPDIPGFGNLHTINTWWFSQLIVKEEVFLQPAYLTCGIQGATTICVGGQTQLNSEAVVNPSTGTEPDEIFYAWTGSGIAGSTTEKDVLIEDGGVYGLTMQWINGVGDTCATTCMHIVDVIQPDTGYIDTLILQGESVEINGQVYSEAGEYVQTIENGAECDSVLQITVAIINTVILYDLDDCYSWTTDISPMDYSEFIPQYPQPVSCADISGSIIYRDNPQVNKHSCTPGVFDSPAMCISSLDNCEYDPGNDKSLVVEVTINPAPDTAVVLSLLTFYERSPIMYNWISGGTGGNNYPTLFGLRVLKNGVEIFVDPAIPTQPDWHELSFDFSDNDDFITTEEAVYRFEFLPYCLIDNDSLVAAWDIDHVQFFAACLSPSVLDPFISGEVKSLAGLPLSDVVLRLHSSTTNESIRVANTDTYGQYTLGQVPVGAPLSVSGAGRQNWTDGVNALDLITIQNHLLGKHRFSSPFQYLAADADANLKISAMDLVQLKKLLLGLYTELPNNDSWQIGNPNEAISLENPYAFDRYLNFESIQDDVLDANFVGVKTGDVTGVSMFDQEGEVDVRSGRSFSASYQRESHTDRIAIVANENIEIQALQIQFDQAVSVVSGSLIVQNEDYAVTADGFTRLIWLNENDVKIRKGDILFYIQSNHFPSVVQDEFRSEVYKAEETIEFRIEGAGREVDANKDFVSVHPNPFHSVFQLNLSMENEGIVTIVAHDLSGKTLMQKEILVVKGENHLTINATDLSDYKGILFLQAISQSKQQMVKLISY